MKSQFGYKNPAFRHGHSTRAGQSSEYMAWSQMIQRCKNPNNEQYRDYGARGIKVCDRWKTFSNFIKDMGAKPHGFTLERRDNSKGYSPSNCHWATRSENNNNKRNCIMLSRGGVTATAAQWSRKSPVTYRAFHKRIGRGWTLEQALTVPNRGRI